MSWREWLGWWGARIQDRCAQLTHLLGLVAFLLTLGGLLGSLLGNDNPWTNTVGLLSVVLGGVFLLYYLAQVVLAMPPRLKLHEELGKKHSLTILERLPEGCVKIALVGLGAVGKTTLLHALVAMEEPNAQTVDPEVTLFTHPQPEPVRLLAYLDAAGQVMQQQLDIIDRADCLVLLLDHNEENVRKISNARKYRQAVYVDQLVHRVRERQQGNPVIAIHVLRNKRDLWSQCDARHRPNLLMWFGEQVDKLRAAMPPHTVSQTDHTNELTADIEQVRGIVMQLARQVVQRRQPHP